MEDRELLELAAKAAGIEYGADRLECGLSLTTADGRHRSLPRWNPLEDDGDALRLAIECDMTVCADGIATVSACSGYGHDRVMVTQTVSECGGDKRAATRRAIVRAAAALAQATPSGVSA